MATTLAGTKLYRATLGGFTLEPEAISWRDRSAADGYVVPSNVLAEVNTLIVQLKAAGVWANCLAFYDFRYGVADGASITAAENIASTSYKLTGAVPYKKDGGKGSGCLNLNGSNNGLVSSDTLTPPVKHTMLSAVYDADPATTRTVMLVGSTTAGLEYRIGSNGAPSSVLIGGSPSTYWSGSTAVQNIVPVNTWCAMGGTYIAGSGLANINDMKINTSANTVAQGGLGTIRVGARNTTSTTQYWSGYIGMVILFNTNLSAANYQIVSDYIASTQGIEQRAVYADSVSGVTSGVGLWPGFPRESLNAAMSQLDIATVDRGGTVYVYAPVANPDRTTLTFTYSAIPTSVWNVKVWPGRGETKYYLYGSTKVTTWTSLGGNVYSTTGFPVKPGLIFLPDEVDGNGQLVRLKGVGFAGETPSAGNFSWNSSTGTVKIRLYDSSDPNGRPVEVATNQNNYVIRSGSALVRFYNAVSRGSTNAGISTGSQQFVTAGNTYWEDCRCECCGGAGATTYTGGGGFVIATGPLSFATYVRCYSENNIDDGFGVHGIVGAKSTAYAIDCHGNYNNDEGISPHDDTILYIMGGEYSHNQSGGIASVGNNHTEISGGTIFNDNAKGGISQEAGIYLTGNATMIVNGATANNNNGPGVFATNVANITILSLTTSGNARANQPPSW